MVLQYDNIGEFRHSLNKQFCNYLDAEKNRFDAGNCLKIDLHCHDLNSDTPDELWGRILRLPETWLKTGKLIECLSANGCNVFTVTNHNNAKSCWQLKEEGFDVLAGAEFTCHFEEYQLFVHVLAYGFDQHQETRLNELRGNIYSFLKYAHSRNIPVILPHPLYFYTRNDKIDLSLFEKLAVLFQRFEVLNGQRDQWQSVLTLNWINDLTPEKIYRYARKHNLDPSDYGVEPDKPKVLTGGSDDHMGIFAGQSGSYLYVENLQQRLKTTPASELALEALRRGDISPFGHVGENQKLNIALLDYFSQVALYIRDPGLLRILFHRGEISDKMACFAIGNLLLEMQKHKNTQKFFKFIHSALHGKKPGKLVKWKIKKDYRFCIQVLENIADSRNQSSEVFINTVNDSIFFMFSELSRLAIKRIGQASDELTREKMECFSTAELTRVFEIPSQVTGLIFGTKNKKPDMSNLDFGKVFDNLTFPALVGSILLGTTMGSTRLLYQNRQFLNEFADHLGRSHHPRRALYLTDTLRDKNGVSSSLSAKLKAIQTFDMPIDFLICDSNAESEAHLHVVRPLATCQLKEFGDQEIRFPDFMEIARIFYQGGYDRVVCSTEGPMSLIALLIKHMFNVPAFFFMHTDWLEFIKQKTDLTLHERDRLRRILRFFYKQFSGGIFVLNDDHRDWLTGHQMQLDEDHVFLTAHHTDPRNPDVEKIPPRYLFEDATDNTRIMIFAGRLSKEKGISDIIDVYQTVKASAFDVRLIIAGSGPDEALLRQQIPNALFTGWVDKHRLASLYASSDLMLFPSRFDTFGNVILEAFTYGLPVFAYNCKGPKNIVDHGVSGFLSEDSAQMARQIQVYLANSGLQKQLRKQVFNSIQQYQARPIMEKFINDLGLSEPRIEIPQQSVA